MTGSDHASEKSEHAEQESRMPSPRDQDLLWDLEERFWSSGAKSAKSTTAKDAVMILPYPPGIFQGDKVWNFTRENTGWRTVAMTERRVTWRDSIAILTYRVSAEKPNLAIYVALCASTYLHDEDRWFRLSHQQTVVA
ncbi:hypothetical protein [Palleronia salina]|uniref:hypothetical protein n=1 Tax=Palleronia salina TaxID=313368 RepID=UPI001F26C7EB|nr:hypothetical protein [Palleronia salina]